MRSLSGPEDLLRFYQLFVAAQAPRRCKFSALVFSKAHSVPKVDESGGAAGPLVVVRVDDAVAFRRSMHLFPSCL